MRPLTWLVPLLLLGLPADAAAQLADGAPLAAYFRAVGGQFRVPADEISVLSEWRLPAEEIPVVLWVARRAGISPDAVVALRQAGRGWSDVASRYRLDASAFHVALAGEPGSLGRAYAEYRGRPPAQWSAIQLDDAEIVGLVNLRVLAEILGVAPAALVQARDRTGSWVDAYGALARR